MEIRERMMRRMIWTHNSVFGAMSVRVSHTFTNNEGVVKEEAHSRPGKNVNHFKKERDNIFFTCQNAFQTDPVGARSSRQPAMAEHRVAQACTQKYMY